MPASLFPMIDGRPSPIGTEYFGIVARDVTDADIEHQRDFNDRTRGAFFKNGQPKFVMKVPLYLPTGVSQWYVKGAVRDELVRALSAAGAPPGPPKEGWGVHVKKIGERPVRNLHPAAVYAVAAYTPDQAKQYAAQMGITGIPGDPKSLLESEAERMFWKAYERSNYAELLVGLTPQYPVGPYRLDFAIPSRSLGIEIDGYEYHSSPEAFARDRGRQRELDLLGWRIIRFTGKEACETPDKCIFGTAEAVLRDDVPTTPDAITERDLVTEWVRERTVPTHPGTPSRQLYHLFCSWRAGQRDDVCPLRETAFGRVLTDMGYPLVQPRSRPLSVWSAPFVGALQSSPEGLITHVRGVPLAQCAPPLPQTPRPIDPDGIREVKMNQRSKKDHGATRC